MTYLINPMVFYFIGLFSALKGLSIALVLVLILTSIIPVICYFEGGYNPHKEMYKKWIKVASICLMISSLLVCIIPSESTMYKMLIASQVTTENINGVKEQVTDIVDYIIDKVDLMQEDK